jgi:glutathione S-transferase/alpha,alpha-trehalase
MLARVVCFQWVVWANASLDPLCFVENDQGQVLDTKLRGDPKQLFVLDRMLAQSSWLVGDAFSAADVAVGSYILYVLLFFPQVLGGGGGSTSQYM